MPVLKIYDSMAQYLSRSNPHRPATAAAYLPIWHADVRSLIVCRTSRATDKYRFTNIFPALWVPNLLCVYHILPKSLSLLLPWLRLALSPVLNPRAYLFFQYEAPRIGSQLEFLRSIPSPWLTWSHW